MNNISTLFLIQKVLKENNYPDYIPVSKEILNSNIPVQKVLKRISKGEPWEYILGYTHFCQNKILVNKHVLIPRVETEKIVEIANNLDVKNVIDVGTGSGCISISLKPDFNITATDISHKALRVGKKNAKLNNRDIRFVKTDLIKDIEIQHETLIIANLPYIPTDFYKNLDRSVKNYEPKIALDGGKSGNELFERLAVQVNSKAFKPKYVLVETDTRIIQDTQRIFKVESKIIQDVYGLERFILFHFI